MDKLLAFAAANPYLVTATVLMLIAVVAFELRLRARAAFEVSVAETVRMINNGAVVVDVREADRYAAGHIVNAVNIAPAELARGEEGKIKKKRGVVVVCDTGNESLHSARSLRAAGFDGAFSLGGGLERWQRDNQALVSGKLSGKR
ncbi:MAG: rhodanese-like domain-containing protein [Gammaproteobacteria bacterium]